MRKVVINKCYGGFGLSKKAIMILAERGVIEGVPVERCYNLPLKEAMEEFKKDEGFMDYVLVSGKVFSCGRDDIERDNPEMVKVVEELGVEANGHNAELRIVEIPDEVKWVIDEYDGVEWIAEEHRTWH